MCLEEIWFYYCFEGQLIGDKTMVEKVIIMKQACKLENGGQIVSNNLADMATRAFIDK